MKKKPYGSVTLALRPDDSNRIEWVIDTYRERGEYVGSYYLKTDDKKLARKRLQAERRRWRKANFKVSLIA